MRRSKVDSFIAFAAVASILALMWALNARRAREARGSEVIEVTESAPDPTPLPTPPEVQPEPDRPPTPYPATLDEVCVTSGGRTLCLPPGLNYDAVDGHCSRKALALLAREHAPGWGELREERFHAAWTACPGFRR